jgi:hypothetical protein
MMLRMLGWGFLAVLIGGGILQAIATWLWTPPELFSLAAGGVLYMAGYCFGGWREGVRIDRSG